MISLIIPGKPIAQQRPRMCRNGHVFNPQSKQKEVVGRMIAHQIREIGVLRPILGSISVNMYIHTAIPLSWPKKRRNEAEGNFNPKRPDCDNYIKFFLDCMNGIVYEDDSQVVRIFCEKKYYIKPMTKIDIDYIK